MVNIESAPTRMQFDKLAVGKKIDFDFDFDFDFEFVQGSKGYVVTAGK